MQKKTDFFMHSLQSLIQQLQVEQMREQIRTLDKTQSAIRRKFMKLHQKILDTASML